MATKLPTPLLRCNYMIDHDRGTPFDPNSPDFNPAGEKRLNAAGYRDVGVDMEQFHRPLERLHALAAHGAGIGHGLGVTATAGQSKVRIEPGVAIDGQGRHVYLAAKGEAEINPTAEDPSELPQLVAVDPDGFDFRTPSLSGDFLLTIQWWETYDSDADTSPSAPKQFKHTPWVRFIKPAGHDPDTQVVLARLTLDGSGRVTALSAGGAGAAAREGMDFRAQRVRFDRGSRLTASSVGNRPAGAIEAGEDGLRLSVSSPDDSVRLAQGESGRFSQVQVNAGKMVLGAADDPAVVLDVAEAQVTVGRQAAPGKVQLRDGQGNAAVRLDASTGSAAVKRLDGIAGAITVGSDLALGGALKTSTGQALKIPAAVELGGSLSSPAGQPVGIAGDLAVTGSLRGQGGRPLAVAGDLAVNGQLLDSRGVVLAGNPVRKFRFEAATAQSGDRVTFDIDLQSPRRLTALCIPVFSQPLAANSEMAFAAEVFAVDGNPQALFAQGLGSFSGIAYSTPCVSTVGQIVTFRVSALGRSQYVGAVGIVFYE